MSARKFINFRDSIGAVSDGADGVCVKYGVDYPTSSNGLTYGALLGAEILTIDNGQYAGGDSPSLYGFCLVQNDGGRFLQLDLAPGVYKVWYAIPKLSYTRPVVVITDADDSVLDTFSAAEYTGDDAREFLDVEGGSHAFGADPELGAFRTITVTGDHVVFHIGDAGGSRTRLSFIAIEPAGGGGGGGGGSVKSSILFLS